MFIGIREGGPPDRLAKPHAVKAGWMRREACFDIPQTTPEIDAAVQIDTNFYVT
ncbi:MAG: hypothetical protein HYZ13_07295 [Acidobacteria bacterium]|nr:hypothetical protein [Acidobacteriota bacterium]